MEKITAHRFILLLVGTVFAIVGLMLLMLTPYYWPVFAPMALIGIAALALAFLASDETCERIIEGIKENVIRLVRRR